MKLSLSKLSNHLEERIRDYLITAYLTKDDEFNRAREELINDRIIGPMFREPLFEIQDRYLGSGMDLCSYVSQNNILGPKSLDKTVQSFLKKIAPHELYKHQILALETIFKNDRHLVVTTGTGSGKTLSFIIPTLLEILSEGIGNNSTPPWSTPKISLNQWWKKSPKKFVKARNHNSRPPALRALFMYPLNALVQDQIQNLREILNSDEAEAMYKSVLGEERIYFGQYNSSTPGRGLSDDQRSIQDCIEALKEIEKQTIDVDENHKHLIERIDTSELLTRWDIQCTPPDILITNYSMLSIMLVRDLEQQIFEQTKRWLQSNKENKFFLVIDELHSYRGTPGTEISYILKSFLGRIGLSPEHSQLKIIATSASLDNESGQDVDHPFLSDFFGTSRDTKNFEVISGPKIEFDEKKENNLFRLKDLFAQYFRRIDEERSFEKVCEEVSKTLACDPINLGVKLNEFGVENSLLNVRNKIKNELNDALIESPPLTYTNIANSLFEGDLDSAKGFLEFITTERDELKYLDLKVRMHLFVRNLTGISRAMKFEDNKLIKPQLYEKGVSVCPKEKVICMESCYCQECGELYFSAFRREFQRRGAILTFLAAEIPSGSRVQDLHQVLFYFGNEDLARSNQGWEKGRLNVVTGEYSTFPEHVGETGWFIERPYNNPPNECPVCEAKWSKRSNKITSPIRTMGTGYHKLNQVIIEQLLGTIHSLSKSKSEASTKLVVFSDSRRDASHISAELEKNHYKDTVRAIVEEFLSKPGGDRPELVDLISKAKEMDVLDLEDHPFSKNVGMQDALLVFQYVRGQLSLEKKPKEYEKAKCLVEQGEISQIRFNSIVDYVEDALYSRGINPGGLHLPKRYAWPDLYLRDSKDKDVTTSKDMNNEREWLRKYLKKEIRMIITDAMGKDFEALGYGWLTFNHHMRGAPKEGHEILLIDSVIRHLAFHWTTRSSDSEGRSKLLGNFCKWLKKNYSDLDALEDNEQISSRIQDILLPLKVIDRKFVTTRPLHRNFAF